MASHPTGTAPATSWVVCPVRSSTSSTREKSTAGASTAKWKRAEPLSSIFDDAADREALGEERAQARGDHEVARRDARAVAGHELEAHRAARVAFHEPGGAGALHHRAHRGGRIVEELDHRSARWTCTTRPTRPSGHDDRRLLGDAVAAPAIDGQGAHPAPRLAPDDLAGHGGQGQPVAQREQPPEPLFSSRVSPAWSDWTRSCSFSARSGPTSRPHRLPVDVVGPEAEGAAMDADQQALDGGEQRRRAARRPAPVPPPARLHRQEQKRHEQHREKDPVSAKSHRSVTLTADRSCDGRPEAGVQAGIATFLRRLELVQDLARAERDAGQRIVADGDGQVRLLRAGAGRGRAAARRRR